MESVFSTLAPVLFCQLILDGIKIIFVQSKITMWSPMWVKDYMDKEWFYIITMELR